MLTGLRTSWRCFLRKKRRLRLTNVRVGEGMSEGVSELKVKGEGEGMSEGVGELNANYTSRTSWKFIQDKNQLYSTTFFVFAEIGHHFFSYNDGKGTTRRTC